MTSRGRNCLRAGAAYAIVGATMLLVLWGRVCWLDPPATTLTILMALLIGLAPVATILDSLCVLRSEASAIWAASLCGITAGLSGLVALLSSCGSPGWFVGSTLIAAVHLIAAVFLTAGLIVADWGPRKGAPSFPAAQAPCGRHDCSAHRE
jgi:hypothetical protein